jgi:hypothetical protein
LRRAAIGRASYAAARPSKSCMHGNFSTRKWRVLWRTLFPKCQAFFLKSFKKIFMKIFSRIAA